MTSTVIESVAADSNVLLSAVAGHAARRVFVEASRVRVVTTEMNLVEVRQYLPRMATKYRLNARDLEKTLILLPLAVVPEIEYRSFLTEARDLLEERDPDDLHLAALALSLRIPVWTNDKDFELLPLPVYPTAVLLNELGI